MYYICIGRSCLAEQISVTMAIFMFQKAVDMLLDNEDKISVSVNF